MFFEACDPVTLCKNFDVIWRFLIVIQRASTTPSMSNQLRNAYTVQWESRNITTQPGETDDGKSKVIVFVVHVCVNVTANIFLY